MAEQLMIYNVGGRYATTASIKKEMENQNDEENNKLEKTLDILKIPEILKTPEINTRNLENNQSFQPKQSTPNLRITPYSSKDNDEGIRTGDDNTSTEKVKALVKADHQNGVQNNNSINQNTTSQNITSQNEDETRKRLFWS